MLPILQDIDKLRPYVATVPAPSRYPHDKDSEDFVISSSAVELDFKKKYKLDYIEVEMLLDGAGESWCITYSSLLISDAKRRANECITRARFTAPIPTFGSASPASRGFELCP